MHKPEFILPTHSAPLDFKFGMGKDGVNMYVSVHGNGFYDATKVSFGLSSSNRVGGSVALVSNFRTEAE
jgi:hypothetical protein